MAPVFLLSARSPNYRGKTEEKNRDIDDSGPAEGSAIAAATALRRGYYLDTTESKNQLTAYLPSCPPGPLKL
jgi:hypothetical protein